MKQYLCQLVDACVLWSDVTLLAFDAPDLASALRPGQFARLRDPGSSDPYLRRVAWFYAREGARVSFALPTSDALVARVRVGDTLDVLAPFGRAIEFDANAQRLALIGDDARVVQLIALAHEAIVRGREVVLVHRADWLFPAHLLSPEIELRNEEDALDQVIAWADAVVVSGSDTVRHSVVESIRAVRYRLAPEFARAFVDVAMPCGTGICYACAIETAHGIKRACVDGPAFDLAWFEKRGAR